MTGEGDKASGVKENSHGTRINPLLQEANVDGVAS